MCGLCVHVCVSECACMTVWECVRTNLCVRAGGPPRTRVRLRWQILRREHDRLLLGWRAATHISAMRILARTIWISTWQPHHCRRDCEGESVDTGVCEWDGGTVRWGDEHGDSPVVLRANDTLNTLSHYRVFCV